MIPNVSRGYSFKGVTAYLTHDARENTSEPHPQTAERVGFTRLYNFLPGEARTPQEAAKVMALTVRDADRIKRQAGINPCGKAEAPPVYHVSLSWAKSQVPTEAQKEGAIREAAERAGVSLDKGYLAYAVEHTDTEHHHVHFVVCLVHPETGKQANPHRDQPKLQSWARDYERRHGQVFCKDREAKYAALDRLRSSRDTPTRAAFNDNSRGAAATAAPDRFGRSRERQPRQPGDRQPRKGLERPEGQARKEASDDNRAGQEAADRIKADSAARWSALKAAEKAAFTQRQAEAARFYADRKAGREAIFEKYKTAFDGLWKPQGGPKQASPDRSRLWQSIRDQQAARQQTFQANERSAIGRIRNAVSLAGKGASLLKTVRLAVSAEERRHTFERGQRAIVARTLPREQRQPSRPTPKTPEPKRVQAERVKAMRTAELAAYARETTARAAAMKGRHAFQIAAEKDARAMLAKETKAAWQRHEAAYGVRKSAAEDRKAAAPRPPSPQPDRFGRSRDRQPRDAREPRGERAGQGRGVAAPIVGTGQKSSVEPGYLSAQFAAPNRETPHKAPPEPAQRQNSGEGEQEGRGGPPPPQQSAEPVEPTFTPEEWDKAVEAERLAREERERGHEADQGRTR
jgi:hypothetical protein